MEDDSVSEQTRSQVGKPRGQTGEWESGPFNWIPGTKYVGRGAPVTR